MGQTVYARCDLKGNPKLCKGDEGAVSALPNVESSVVGVFFKRIHSELQVEAAHLTDMPVRF